MARDLFLHALVFLSAYAAMEGVAWASHKYVMHGFLWCLHRSHHRRKGLHTAGWFEWNDLFGVFFAAVALAFAWMALRVHPLFGSASLGMLAYGLTYLFMHDILAHKRFGITVHPQGRYLRRVVQSHRLHHARNTREGCVSFGFLVPMSPRRGTALRNPGKREIQG